MTQLLQALEKLGWIRRRRSRKDARQLEIELTEPGRTAYGEAEGHFNIPAWAYEGPLVALGWPKPRLEERVAWDRYTNKMERLHTILKYIRLALRDTGCLRYPWECPD